MIPTTNVPRPAMLELSRTVRFSISFAPPRDAAAGGDASEGPKHNTYAGHPSMAGLGAYYELEVRVRGEAEPLTGYLVNISAIDEAVRRVAIPVIGRVIRDEPQRAPGRVLREVARVLEPALDASLVSVRWRLTPYYSITLRADDMSRVILSQSFDFAAAHRLHSPELSDAENRAVFGPCNNPNGHGHNYRVEVHASAPIETDASRPLTLQVLEQVVDETLIRRFDHTHLNLDTAEFAGLNPSVENIAKVCHDLLAGPVEAAGGRLERVTVWETDRTSCTFPA